MSLGMVPALSLQSKPGQAPPAVPVNSVAPVIEIEIGSVLQPRKVLIVSSNGTWTNSPTGYTYQWQRDGVNLAGETNDYYVVRQQDGIDATDLKCKVTASNAEGAGSPADSNTLGPVAAMTYVPVASAAAARGVFSHTFDVMGAGAGNCVDLILNNTTTQTFAFETDTESIYFGGLNYDDVIAWRDSVDATALIRVSQIYTKGVQAVNAVQATDASRPILNPNNVRRDGHWPASFNAFSGRSGENNNFLTIASTLTHNRANFTMIAVIDAITNVAISSTGPQVGIMAQTLATGASSNSMVYGANSFTGTNGLGNKWGSGPTNSFATPNLILDVNSQVCLVTQSTANTIDGVAAPNYSLRVNETGRNYTAATTNTTSATNSGRIGGESGATFGGFAGYAFFYYANTLAVAGDDDRSAVMGPLVEMFNCPLAAEQTHQLVVYASSSGANYRTNTNGIVQQLAKAFGPRWRVNPFTRAGTSNNDLNSAKVQLVGRIDTSLVNVAFYYNVRNNIEAGDNGVTTWTNQTVPFLQEIQSSKPGTLVIVATQVGTVYTNQAAADVQLAAYNAEVMDPTNMATYGYIGVDTAGLPEFADFNDTTYYDPDKIHLNETGCGVFANAVEAAIRANL